jgi:rRNA-processing protein FCF1
VNIEDSFQSIVIDATALIDFLGSEKSILPLISKRLGKLHVTRPVLEEVADLRKSQCGRLGITIVDLTFAQYKEASSLVGGLSFEDCTCFILARDNGWICITNDKRLRSECCRHGIGCLWGLETIVRLVQTLALAPTEACAIGKTICRLNPFIKQDIFEDFRRLIGMDPP